jgi:hypothetical protein
MMSGPRLVELESLDMELGRINDVDRGVEME